MLRKIKLYGELAKFLGQKTFEAEVSSAAQAIKFLLVNFPEVEKHISERYYKVSVGKWELSEEELLYPSGLEDIKIIPVIGGAGGRNRQISFWYCNYWSSNIITWCCSCFGCWRIYWWCRNKCNCRKHWFSFSSYRTFSNAYSC